eukprot:jgi/Chlat1/6199/Chrsp44S05809
MARVRGYTEQRMKFSTEFDSQTKDSVNRFSFQLPNGQGKLKASFPSIGTPWNVGIPVVGFKSDKFEAYYNADDGSCRFSVGSFIGNKVRMALQHDITPQGNDSVVDLNANVGEHDDANVSVMYNLQQAAVVRRSEPSLAECSIRIMAMSSQTPRLGSVDLWGFLWAKKDNYTVIPSFNAATNACSLALKRNINAHSKISTYFDATDSNLATVYKHKLRHDLTLKAKFDTSTRAFSLEFLAGHKHLGAKHAPKVGKVLAELVVPQEVDKTSFFVKSKKRFDF